MVDEILAGFAAKCWRMQKKLCQIKIDITFAIDGMVMAIGSPIGVFPDHALTLQSSIISCICE